MSEVVAVSKNIIEWLTKNGATCYFNQTNHFNIPTFRTTGGNSKFDVLAVFPSLTLGIEIKKGDANREILDGFQQTLEYAGEYYSGNKHYYIGDSEVEIGGFVLATSYSSSGFLYRHENEYSFVNYTNDFLMDKDLAEKPITFEVIRLMWRMWDKSPIRSFYEAQRIGNKTKGVLIHNCPRVGVLLANTKRASGTISTEPFVYLNTNMFINLKTGQQLRGVFE